MVEFSLPVKVLLSTYESYLLFSRHIWRRIALALILIFFDHHLVLEIIKNDLETERLSGPFYHIGLVTFEGTMKQFSEGYYPRSGRSLRVLLNFSH